MNLPIGEIAALLTAFSFSLTSICFTFAGRKISAITLVAMSMPISWLLIVVIHQLTLGTFFPMDATPDRWLYLGASGILAFGIASYFMLNAYQYIGPRLTMLVASFAPVLGAILAWIFLGQTLPANAIIGVIVVIFGIIWVVAEPRKDKSEFANPNFRRGILYACLMTLAQSTAFVFSSQGVSGDFSPFSATMIRLTVGIVAIWIVIAFQGNIKSTITIYNHDLRLFFQLLAAAILGPVIAGSLLLFSFQRIPVGIATTLSHTTAIILIPLSYFFFKEKVTLRAIIGTVIAIVGIAIIFS